MTTMQELAKKLDARPLKERVEEFTDVLIKIKGKPRNLFGNGLVVKELGSKTNKKEILEILNDRLPQKVVSLVYDQEITDETIVDQLVRAFEAEKWVLLEIKKDLGSPLLNQLKHLQNRNSLQLFDYQGQSVFNLELTDKSRLVVFAERDLIENKISYPHFYGIFGPVLSLK